MKTYTAITTAEDVTPAILNQAEAVYDGWYSQSPIDWGDFIDRLDGTELEDGTYVDLGESMTSGAIKKIKSHINQYRKL